MRGGLKTGRHCCWGGNDDRAIVRMKIANVKVHNYRSLDEITVPLYPYTVIVGQNNVGKSNILRAIDLFFSPPPLVGKPKSLHFEVPELRRRFHSSRSQEYDFTRDFPILAQSKPGPKCTEIALTLALEAQDFDRLTLAAKFRRRKLITVKELIWRDGRGEGLLEYRCDGLKRDDAIEFLQWLFQVTEFVRMPSSRSYEASQKLLRSFSRRTLAGLRASLSVRRSLESLRTRAEKDLRKAEQAIRSRLIQYLPELEAISFELKELPELYEIVEVGDIQVNDGRKTSLQTKGDGVQSLFYIGLLQYMSTLKVNRNLLFGIEEPELHLHPNAQEELLKTLRLISRDYQVIITTHSPVLVSKGIEASNIVISRDKKTGNVDVDDRPTLRTIRTTLGVKPPHNLENANLVVLVEGAIDEMVIRKALVLLKPEFRDMLESAELFVQNYRGAPGAVDHLRFMKQQVQRCIALFDRDQAGIAAHTVCLQEQLLEPESLLILPAREGFRETELEDMLPLRHSVAALAVVGINLSEDEYKQYQRATGSGQRKPGKWSDIIKHIVDQRGYGADPTVFPKVKEAWSKSVMDGILGDEVPDILITLTDKAQALLKTQAT